MGPLGFDAFGIEQRNATVSPPGHHHHTPYPSLGDNGAVSLSENLFSNGL